MADNFDTPILPKPDGLNLLGWAQQLVQVLTLWFQRQQDTGVPAGTVFPFLGAEIPAGYLELNGQEVSKQTFRALYYVLGDGYNTGSEAAGNFRLPDAAGRVFMQDTANLFGGADDVTLGLAQLPNVAITVNDPGHLHGVNAVLAPSSTANVGSGSVPITTGTNVNRASTMSGTGITARLNGGGNPVSLKQKYFGGRWMVKT